LKPFEKGTDENYINAVEGKTRLVTDVTQRSHVSTWDATVDLPTQNHKKDQKPNGESFGRDVGNFFLNVHFFDLKLYGKED
jgi:hypothetical protein